VRKTKGCLIRLAVGWSHTKRKSTLPRASLLSPKKPVSDPRKKKPVPRQKAKCQSTSGRGNPPMPRATKTPTLRSRMPSAQGEKNHRRRNHPDARPAMPEDKGRTTIGRGGGSQEGGESRSLHDSWGKKNSVSGGLLATKKRKPYPQLFARHKLVWTASGRST